MEPVLLVGDEFTVRMQLAEMLEDRKRDGFIFLPCPLLADSVEKVDHGFHGREVGVRD